VPLGRQSGPRTAPLSRVQREPGHEFRRDLIDRLRAHVEGEEAAQGLGQGGRQGGREVVAERRVGRRQRPDRRYVRDDLALEVLVAEIRVRPRVEALVGVSDVQWQDPADVGDADGHASGAGQSGSWQSRSTSWPMRASALTSSTV
jgi:hypothetical protein